ncbi:hypothetical protein EJ110_NYTH52115 [Nymphaea thermarum]|nr:hypothetical protein EJ110_NYTH52115 [Nymphaea thermarum]
MVHDIVDVRIVLLVEKDYTGHVEETLSDKIEARDVLSVLDDAQQMEYQRRCKKRRGPTTKAQREPSSAHSDAHTRLDDSTSGQPYSQTSVGAQTPPRQTPLEDQQTILLTTLQTLTSLVQSMVSNKRSHASPIGDTTTPPKEKAASVSFKQFMSMQPPVFTGYGSPNTIEEWIEEVERIFELLKMPEGVKVNYGTYLLKGDAKWWWQQSISWKQFRDSFFSAYFSTHARNKKMQEFLELQQNNLSLEEYVTKYRHLEVYYPHLYTTDEAKANKFVHGLRDGLRSKVMSRRPHDLDEAVTMARRMEEDWARIQKDHHKKTDQHSHGGQTQVRHHHFVDRAKPYERHDDRAFRRNRSNRSDTTQRAVTTLTLPRCPTCSRVHPRKPCYWETGACLHCGKIGHFIKNCPIMRGKELKKPKAGPSSVEKTTRRVYTTTVDELQAHDFIEEASGLRLCVWEMSRGSRLHHWYRLLGAQAVQSPRVLAEPRQQIDQMTLLTSYWGGFGSIVVPAHHGLTRHIQAIVLKGIKEP